MVRDSEPLLLVEDHATLADELTLMLGMHGYAVSRAATLHDARAVLGGAKRPRLAVVDVGLPDGDGVSLAAELRAAGIGIVFLSARRELDERLRALEVGDAWLTKPVDVRELVAHLRAVGRRADPPAPLPAAQADWTLCDGGWSLRHRPSDRALMLGANERAFLLALQRSPGEPVDRDTLALALGFSTDWHDRHRLEMLVSRLRARVQQAIGQPLPVMTARGRGYAASLPMDLDGDTGSGAATPG